MRSCKECSLHEEAIRSVPGFSTSPLANIDCMLIGEGPGEDEDNHGLPFIGKAGQLLQQILTDIGLTENIYITNVVKHRPPKNRKPHKHEMKTCGLHFLLREIDEINPKKIVCLGRTSAEYLLEILELPFKGSLRGHRFMYMDIPVLCTWHPAYILRREDKLSELLEDLTSISMSNLTQK